MKKISFFIGFFITNTVIVYSLLLNSSCQSKTKPSGSLERIENSQTQVAGAIAPIEKEDNLLIQNMKQLTYAGQRAGEGYFNADGTQMIFQSERQENNPFYQIYRMDLKTGKTELVSPGFGKTTCSWLHPQKQKALFSSTHLDPNWKQKEKDEWAQRKSAQKNKYAWSYDEYFDIFEKDIKTGTLKRLTKEIGYDAEGSYSPDGGWIAFASNRSGYSEKLEEAELKLFQQDPSYMMDIYIMKADGSQIKRLTNVKGYDGGPFFSQDGRKITWRRFSANGQWAEIWTMNVDGSEQKQLTNWKAMSWAPYFHPSGDYLIFTSNRLGYSNFELYIVDSAGKREPVRASFLPDFDGLPVFSPNGQQLSWTHRNEKGESQIYIADWDDKKARELLGLEKKVELKLSQLSPSIEQQDIKAVVEYLASEKMAGRKTGGAEEKIYTQTLSELFKEMGLKNYPSQKSMISPFEFTSDVSLGSDNKLELELEGNVVNAKLNSDFIPLAISKRGNFTAANIVFAGYGIVAPASDKESLYDSYKNLDVNGKWVLIFKDIPENVSNSRRIHLNIFSRMEHKILVAKQRGALGVLIVQGPNQGGQQKLMKLKHQGGSSESALPVVSISNEFAEKILKSTGRSLKQWQDIHDLGEIQTTEIAKAKVKASVVDVQYQKSQGLNVVAYLPVKGAQSTLVIGGHGDHLGRGEFGSSLAKNDEQGNIHFGADDNASGVAGVVELAHLISSQYRSGQLKLKHNIAFAVWSGEEIGLLGSTHWLNSMKHNIFSYINMDMIGRLKSNLLVQGVGSAKEWRVLFEQIALQSDLPLILQDDPYTPSDSMAFYLKSIPSVMFFTGAHAEYHSPRDKFETLNIEGEKKVLEVVYNTVKKLSADPLTNQKLSYIKSESSRNQLEGRRFRVYLGTIPDYAQEGVKGVKVSGTSKESPAEKAGILPGDVIVELSGLKIENLYDYVYGLQSLKANQSTQIKVQRQGKIESLNITPMMKE